MLGGGGGGGLGSSMFKFDFNSVNKIQFNMLDFLFLKFGVSGGVVGGFDFDQFNIMFFNFFNL